MTDKNQDVETFDIDKQEDELEALKRQADLLGVQYSTSIGVETLRKRVAAALDTGTDAEAAKPVAKVKRSVGELRKEAAKLVRVRISCHDPMKKEYQGEIFTVMNGAIGAFKQFVLFGEPYHVPNIILQQLKDKKYQQFYTVKDERGRRIRKGRLVRAYSIEYLDPLSPAELDALARDQKARNAVD